MRKKSNRESLSNNYEQKLSKKKQKEEDKELKKTIKETNQQIKLNNKKRRELGRVIEFGRMDELIPIKKAVNRGHDGFEFTHNQGLFNIVQVVSFDYSAMDDDDLSMHVYHWDRFYRTTSIPIKYVSLNMPVDTAQQIANKTAILNRTDNPLYRNKLKKDIEELKGFEGRQTRDYYLMYYANDYDSLINETSHILASLESRGYIVTLSPIKKLLLFNKFSNPYSYKEMLTENFA